MENVKEGDPRKEYAHWKSIKQTVDKEEGHPVAFSSDSRLPTPRPQPQPCEPRRPRAFPATPGEWRVPSSFQFPAADPGLPAVPTERSWSLGSDYRLSFRGRRGMASPQQRRCGGERRRRFSPGSCSRHEPARTPGPPLCSARGRRDYSDTALDEGSDSELGSLAKETILIECA
ncbi:unnamed protein product [Rangifer tarandus platyrhynchus]|uniref:Uncharacterized protein n=1 Tax=Rangifer tarandus platyrhynchus TaxID=3082113 RepID=A0ABN8Y588_RANTA|nr:unnamed protein product [Rangifer tarandus platyrhynchus]